MDAGGATVSAASAPYHHGDLPFTLVQTAISMLDVDGEADLSIRAVARAAGVSSGAPYRHFPDRPSLLAAVAAAGFERLMAALSSVHAEPSTRSDFSDLAVEYVRFATAHPGLFRVMFAESGLRDRSDRRTATAAVHEYLDAGVRAWLGVPDPSATTTGLWALVHGIACLYIGDNLESASADAVEARVRATLAATLAIGDR